MAEPTAPPPTYTQQNEELEVRDSNVSSGTSELQLLISPSPNAFQFQKGYLGADGERAAIEGELQIKGMHHNAWETVTVSLRSVESNERRQVELNAVDVVLFSRTQSSTSAPSSSITLPMSIPFSIPLTPDTPQCIHTIKSSLSHTLTATLHPIDPTRSPLSRSLAVHTRRYTSHLLKLEVSPKTVTSTDPTPVEVQVPRTTYRADEPIPVYITIPPPERSVVLDQGFTLRNVRAELVRTVTAFDIADGGEIFQDSDVTSDSEVDGSSDTSSSSDGEAPSAAFMAAPEQPFFSRPTPSSSTSQHITKLGTSYQTVLSRSGASCRFHSSRPVRLRLVLHKSTQTSPPTVLQSNLPETEYSQPVNDTQCASITQTTLMHSVSFLLQVHTTFVHASNRTERISTLSLPLTLLPDPAPLPEVEPSIDAAYRKKHDRPPTKTVRREDSDVSHVEQVENHAGPSVLASGAPPPFDDAPPPFFSSFPEASTSSRLPTFLESESEVLVPSDDHPAAPSSLPPPRANDLSLVGEGILFGFLPSDQYDGHSGEMQRSSSPPPSLEMARGDADVTDLASLVSQPERALEALNMALDHDEEQSARGGLPPPPPPPMDDPSDPPPSIDSEFRSHASDPPPSIHSEFRSPGMGQVSPPHTASPPPQQSTGPPPDLVPLSLDESSTTAGINPISGSSPSHAPPPYLNPANDAEVHEHVTRPPPYVDLVPSAEESHL